MSDPTPKHRAAEIAAEIASDLHCIRIDKGSNVILHSIGRHIMPLLTEIERLRRRNTTADQGVSE